MNEPDNFGRLSQAVALLGDTLRPYVERELKRAGGNWWTEYVLPAVSPLTRQKLPALPKNGRQRAARPSRRRRPPPAHHEELGRGIPGKAPRFRSLLGRRASK